jgi:segregation and condensation protein A
MVGTKASEAIALLIDLAQQGEINPWDVQVIEVIDRFLLEINFQKENTQEADLSNSGQAFLWASMLILLKANTLSQAQAEQVEEIDIEAREIDLPHSANLPLHLEQHLRRRRSAKPLGKRRVTLEEFIEQIKQIEQQIEKTSFSSKTKSKGRKSREKVAQAITQLAHQENLTEVATVLEQFFLFQFPSLTPQRVDIDLDDLLSHLASFDRVGVFWGLLLLSAQSKVELSQSQFYQEITIKPLKLE